MTRLLAGTLLSASLAGSAASAQQAQPDCSGAEHRRFDFWIGTWEVTVGEQRAGSNMITPTQRGCALHERWTGSGGGTGESLNFYDRGDGRWHQVWIDSQGRVLRLSGQFGDRKMVLSGETPGPNAPIRQRITWFDNGDGTVRQLWETSRDGGVTWSVAFDGLYRKKEP